MQIFVANTAYEVDAATSVETLKAMIENKEFIPLHQIRLVHGGAVLESGSLDANGIEDEDLIGLQLEVAAGMRAKWRKKRMRRLRRKRRKMRARAK
jgi:Ribosomal protein L41/Ubiquitin family